MVYLVMKQSDYLSGRESWLYTIWRAFCQHRMHTQDKRLRGIFAGRLSTACGPDFQGAEFELDGRRYRGDGAG